MVEPNPPSLAAAGLCAIHGGTAGFYASIQAAVNAAGPGDTVRVAPGTYHENVVIRNGSLRLLGATAATTSIDAASSSPANGILIQNVNTETVISGFTVQDAPNEGILIHDSRQVRVRNNIVQGNDTSLHINATTPVVFAPKGRPETAGTQRKPGKWRAADAMRRRRPSFQYATRRVSLSGGALHQFVGQEQSTSSFRVDHLSGQPSGSRQSSRMRCLEASGASRSPRDGRTPGPRFGPDTKMAPHLHQRGPGRGTRQARHGHTKKGWSRTRY